MKAVLLSIKPKYCELIASGKKTVEVRKTKPKLETPFKVYIYETKGKRIRLSSIFYGHEGKGKIIGEFVCDYILRHCEMSNADIAEEQSCVLREDILKYSNGKEVFGWHISNLVIYDKPKELSEFSSGSSVFTFDTNGKFAYTGLKRPPQSWCYVESEVAE